MTAGAGTCIGLTNSMPFWESEESLNTECVLLWTGRLGLCHRLLRPGAFCRLIRDSIHTVCFDIKLSVLMRTDHWSTGREGDHDCAQLGSIVKGRTSLIVGLNHIGFWSADKPCNLSLFQSILIDAFLFDTAIAQTLKRGQDAQRSRSAAV